MELGAFSVSLAVKDIKASLAFYQKLGFKILDGNIEENWLILKNGSSAVGLFQGMFDRNLLTFNPSWDGEGNESPRFADVREIQKRLKEQGITPTLEADENGTGPAHFMIVDPDGNPILVDQHV